MSGARERIIEATSEGGAAYVAGRLDEAVACYQRAAALLGPEEDDIAPVVYENLGLAEHARQRPMAAAQCYLRALDGKLASREQSLRFLVACLHDCGQRHNAARALAAYEAAFGPHPSGWTAAELASCCAGETLAHADDEPV